MQGIHGKGTLLVDEKLHQMSAMGLRAIRCPHEFFNQSMEHAETLPQATRLPLNCELRESTLAKAWISKQRGNIIIFIIMKTLWGLKQSGHASLLGYRKDSLRYDRYALTFIQYLSTMS